MRGDSGFLGKELMFTLSFFLIVEHKTIRSHLKYEASLIPPRFLTRHIADPLNEAENTKQR